MLRVTLHEIEVERTVGCGGEGHPRTARDRELKWLLHARNHQRGNGREQERHDGEGGPQAPPLPRIVDSIEKETDEQERRPPEEEQRPRSARRVPPERPP